MLLSLSMEAGGAHLNKDIHSVAGLQKFKAESESQNNLDENSSRTPPIINDNKSLHYSLLTKNESVEKFFSELENYQTRASFLIQILNNVEASSLVEKIAKLSKLCKAQGENNSLNINTKPNSDDELILNKIKRHFKEDFIHIIAQLPHKDLTLNKINIKNNQGIKINNYSNFFNETHSVMTQKFFQALFQTESRIKFNQLILDPINEASTAIKISLLSKICLDYLKDTQAKDHHPMINTLKNNFSEDFITYLALTRSDESSLKRYAITDSDGEIIKSHGNFFTKTTKLAAQKFFQNLENPKLKKLFTSEILEAFPQESCSQRISSLSKLCSEYIKNKEEYKTNNIIQLIKKHFNDDFILALAQIPNSDQGLKKLGLKNSSENISSYANFLYERPAYLINKQETEKFFEIISNDKQRETFIREIMNRLRGAADVKISKISNLCAEYLNRSEAYEENEIIKAIKANFNEAFISTLAQIPNSNQGLKSLGIVDNQGKQINSYTEILSERKLPKRHNHQEPESSINLAQKGFQDLLEHLSKEQRILEIPKQDLFGLFNTIQNSSPEFTSKINEEEFNRLLEELELEKITHGSVKSSYTEKIIERNSVQKSIHTRPEQPQNSQLTDKIFSAAEALSISEKQFPNSSWDALKTLFKAAAIHKLWNAYEEKNKDEKSTFINALNDKYRHSETRFVKEIIGEFCNEYKAVDQLISGSSNYKQRSKYLEEYGLDLREIAKFNLTQALTILRTAKEADSLLFAIPGSGKTLAAIAAAKFNQSKKTLILCPAAIKQQWQENIRRFSPNQENDFKILPFSKMNNSNIKNINNLIETANFDFIVIDESHYLKGKKSQIHNLTKDLIQSVREKNPELKTLSMTATPILIDLNDIRNSWEAVSGRRIPSQANSYRDSSLLREALVPHSIPFSKIDLKIPISYQTGFHSENYSADLSVIVKLNSERGKELAKKILNAEHPAHLEAQLISAKADNIASHCNPDEKTIIFTNYLNDHDGLNFNVIDELKVSLLKQGFKNDEIAIFTGTHPEGLEEFKTKPDSKILIMSPVSMYGIDGLQNVCSRMIIASSPWTTVIDQMIGRLARVGQKKEVEVLIPSVKISLENGDVLPEYELLKHKIIEERLSLAKSFIEGELLNKLSLDEKSLMKLIQENLVNQIPNNLEDIHTDLYTNPNTELLESDEHPVKGGLSQAPNFLKLSKLINQRDSHRVHQFLNSAGKSLWESYHNEIDLLYQNKVKPMDKLIWKLISKPSLVKSNPTDDSVTIINMGSGRDLLQARMLNPLSKENPNTLYSHLKERLKLKEIKVFDIDHVKHEENISGIKLESLSDNASSLSAASLDKIKNANGADLVIFSQSLIGKDWEYALVQAREILKAKGKILIIDEQSPWKMKHSNLSIDELKRISEELNLKFEDQEEGHYIFFKLEALK